MSLSDDIRQLQSEDATARCRELFDKFNGKDHPPMTFEDQASLLEGFLEAMVMHDGSVAAVIVRNMSDMQLAGMAVTAMRLRRMAAHESEIKRVVTGR